MKQFLIHRWFLIALAIVLAVGFTQGERFEALTRASLLRNSIVATVLFLMSFPLQFGAMWKALRRPGPALLASAINFGLLPIVAWSISYQLSEDLRIGLMVAAATPCTLASAAVWTRRAGGNDAVAIMVTILTNLSCFLITPLWLFTTTGKSANLPPLADMIFKLAVLVVLPITLAQILRLSAPVAAWATRQRLPMGVVAQFGVLTMIFLGSLSAGLKIAEQETPLTSLSLEIGVMIVAVMGVHLSMLFAGFQLARLLGMSRGDAIAVGIAGSQKTLMVGLTMAIQIGGLVVLPMVTYHVGQLLVDTVIADRIRQASERMDEAETA